jgi:NADP-dependent 3-hydroxy acid dehydrogenase YdfG
MEIAVVTGTSSGIGLATALRLARHGYRVFAGMRNVTKAEPLRGAATQGGLPIEVIPLDVTSTASVRSAFDTVSQQGGVDVLVNNAGLGRSAPLSSAPTEPWREMLEVNVLGLCIATREAIQDMERRGVAGHVVHVSSMAGHRIPGIDSGVYAATKFAVRALTEALRRELRERKSPIRVTAISPGYVSTEFADVFSGRPGAAQELDQRVKTLEPGDVADAILWIVTRPAHMEVHDVLVRPTAQKN